MWIRTTTSMMQATTITPFRMSGISASARATARYHCRQPPDRWCWQRMTRRTLSSVASHQRRKVDDSQEQVVRRGGKAQASYTNSLYSPSFLGPSPSYDSRIMQVHLLLLCSSYKRWTGRNLLGLAYDALPLSILVDRAYRSDGMLLSHGIQSDPILNYGNLRAQQLWKVEWNGLTSMPSSQTAEADRREQRHLVLEKVAAEGFVEGYDGVRISTSGERFAIKNVTIWDVVVDEELFDCRYDADADNQISTGSSQPQNAADGVADPRDYSSRVSEHQRKLPLALTTAVSRRKQDGLIKVGQAATCCEWLSLGKR